MDHSTEVSGDYNYWVMSDFMVLAANLGHNSITIDVQLSKTLSFTFSRSYKNRRRVDPVGMTFRATQYTPSPQMTLGAAIQRTRVPCDIYKVIFVTLMKMERSKCGDERWAS